MMTNMKVFQWMSVVQRPGLGRAEKRGISVIWRSMNNIRPEKTSMGSDT